MLTRCLIGIYILAIQVQREYHKTTIKFDDAPFLYNKNCVPPQPAFLKQIFKYINIQVIASLCINIKIPYIPKHKKVINTIIADIVGYAC